MNRIKEAKKGLESVIAKSYLPKEEIKRVLGAGYYKKKIKSEEIVNRALTIATDWKYQPPMPTVEDLLDYCKYSLIYLFASKKIKIEARRLFPEYERYANQLFNELSRDKALKINDFVCSLNKH